MKITTDIKHYNKKNKTVYINGRRRSKIICRPSTHTFEQAIREIDKTFNKYGTLTKCDRILGLYKRGYGRIDCENAIIERLSVIPNTATRGSITNSYMKAIERIR